MVFRQPRITRRDKKLHFSYELDERIHCARIYPLTAPNGSTVVLYGHDRGLRILWRGGKVAKGPQQDGGEELATTNGDKHHAYADDQLELSKDDFVESIDLDLEAEVLNMAVPDFACLRASSIPSFAKSHMLVALADSTAKVKLLSIPMAPPQPSNQTEFIQNGVAELELAGDGSIAQHLTVKVLSHDEDTGADDEDRVLIAATATGLNIWELKLSANSIVTSKASMFPIMHSPISASAVSFHPSPKSSKLLVCDRRGAVRMYDAFASSNALARSSSRDSNVSPPAANDGKTGRWLMSYRTPFYSPHDNTALARCKKILDAVWVLGGRGVLVLLEDGEWGIWDISGRSMPAGKNIEDFALKGYLGSSTAADVSDSGNQRKFGSKLAPMTPNTRKAKAENLFSGPSRATGVASAGGISITSTVARSGPSDESVVMWYNNEAYSISSMQSFWQRSITNNSGDLGSLYAPGLTHISDIILMNENITSISQFNSRSTTSNLGQMNTQRDLLVSAEHRFMILQNPRSHNPSRQLFPQAPERPALRDQRMLDAGELDLGGMDRMLESMTGDRRTRRVGFAS